MVVTIAAGVLLIRPLRAQSGASSPDDFARHYVAASRAHNADARLRFLHPAVRACMLSNPWYRDMIARTATRSGADTMRFRDGFRTVVSPVKGPSKVFILPDSLFAYTVEPSARIEIWSKEGSTTYTAAELLLAKYGSRWFEVLPCPKPGAEEWFTASKLAGERQRARADSLASSIPDALRVELLAMIKEGRVLRAVFRYVDVMHADTTTASMVVDRLRGKAAPPR